MVKYIKYQNKKYPIRTSYYAMKMFQKETGYKVDDLSNADNILQEGLYETLLYYSLVAGTRAEGSELDLTKDDMEMVLDECFMEFINLIPEFFPGIEEGGGQKSQAKGASRKKGK